MITILVIKLDIIAISLSHRRWPIFEGVIYEADMGELSVKTEYVYRVGGNDGNGTVYSSSNFQFTSAPSLEQPDQKVTIATLGDQVRSHIP